MWRQSDLSGGRDDGPALVLALILTALAGLLPVLHPLEQRLHDLRARWISRQVTPDPRIVIIAIDEQSLQQMQAEYGPWPWPRNVYGPVLERCRPARTAAVDLLFAETKDDPAAPGGDLFAGMTGAPTNVVLASVLTREKRAAPQPDAGAPALAIDAKAIERLDLPAYASRIGPAPAYAKRVAATGFANYLTDTDGVVRNHLLVAKAGERYYPSFALEACCRYLGANARDISITRLRLFLGNTSVPIDRFGRYPFVPIHAGYKSLSFVDVLRGDVSTDGFAGKLVFIGSTATGLQGDRQVTSIDVYTPGVRALAWAADGLLNQRYFRFLSGWFAWPLALVLAAAPFRLPLRTPYRAAGSLAVHLLALAAISLGVLRLGYWMLPAAWMATATVAGHTTVGTVGWLADRRRRRQLEELEQQKQQFTDMLVHDLRNQLAPIRMAFSIEEDAAQQNDAPMPRHLDTAQQSLARTLVMLNTLLDIRRSQEGRLPVSPTRFPLPELFASLEDAYRGMTARRRLTLQTRVSGDSPTILLDRDLLQRILDNLLLNALQHATPDTTIELEGIVSPDQAFIELRNLGPPIPPEDQERIFELFRAGEQSRRRRFGGTGIGLAFCRLAVDTMGGSIAVTSPWQHGQGVRITLTFPQPGKHHD